MRFAALCLMVVAAIASLGVLWLTAMPLGIPGEWTWDRVPAEPDSLLSGLGAAVAAGLYVAVVRLGWNRLSRVSKKSLTRVEVCTWLAALVAMSFAWLWVVQEAAPLKNRLGKSAFVLYYPSSSGYFTKARYEEPSPTKLLAGYEALMRQRDVLHVGTHPPGLFLVFHGLIAACEFSPRLASFLDTTQPASFVEACDVIAYNSLRSKTPRPFMPLDRRVLWLATLLVLLSAALVVVPLYGVVRLTHDSHVAWLTAALWPAIPAVAVFMPKSDVVYAFIGMMFVWTWLLSLRRRSVLLALIAGGIAWCSLMCSLAFLPVFLFAALASWRFVPIATSRFGGFPLPVNLKDNEPALGNGRCPQESSPLHRDGWRNWIRVESPARMCLIAVAVGFLLPLLLTATFGKVNLPVVWWLNYQNHAGFYAQYTRTYWKWLLVNPVELSFAAGLPLAVVAVRSVVTTTKRHWSSLPQLCDVVSFGWMTFAMLFVWGTLWLTGKNSGEAARLWIVFLPWLVWQAGPLLAEAEAESRHRWLRPVWVMLAIQLAVCLLTVAHVSRFHFDS